MVFPEILQLKFEICCVVFLCSDTLSVVASEHRPFSTKQRALGKEDFMKIPHGVAGVQDRMSVIWERGVVRVYPLCYTPVKQTSFSFSSHWFKC